MTNNENTMMRMRPVGLRIRCVKPLPCGMRSFIFCLADFSSDLATTGNSLMLAAWAPRSWGNPPGRLPIGRSLPSCPTSASPLPAAGARVEVQVDGIAGHGDTDKVTDIDSQPLGRAGNVHVVCLYREIQFAGLLQHVLAEGL